MPFDLKRINWGKGAQLVQPRDIFSALPGFGDMIRKAAA